MAINQLYRLAVECGAVNASGKVVNVFHYVQTSADVSANGATSLVLTWNAQMTASYVATFSSSVQYEGLRARNIDNPTEGLDFTRAVPAPGTVTGDMVPPQIASLITWQTGLIGRSFRGRTYLPPTGESAIGNAGALTAGQLAAMATFAEAAKILEATVDHPSYQLVVYSPLLDTRTPVNAHRIRGGAATQRKRAQ